MRRWISGCACVVALGLAAVAPRASGETVHLKNGSQIRGELLSRSEERVVVDLGFTVLSVPGDAVERIAEDAEPAAGDGADEAVAATGDLWSAAHRRPEMTIKQNVTRCGEAVVQIRTAVGLGSGFVIHPDGYVITNDHVIAGEREVSVTVYEQTERELLKRQYNNIRIIATNPELDLALLKIERDANAEGDSPRFQTVPLGDSDGLRQGQTVFAIGSPLGLERSVSQGIVSLKNRAMEGRTYIQTTTQINPGNSGGPLFNTRGEVIGVTNMKIVTTGAEGLGFAIPVNTLKHFVANRDAFAFDPRNPNAGFKYNTPPTADRPLGPAPSDEAPAAPAADAPAPSKDTKP